MAATTCICGHVSKSKGGDHTHGRTCPAERARSEAFIKAVQEGRGEDAWRDGYAAARKAMAAR